MDRILVYDKTFDNTDFTEKPLQLGDYENCSFINCDLSNAVLSEINFTECEFTGCNLSLAKVSQTAFRDIVFKDCKLLGLHFEYCNIFLFKVDFENSLLNLSSFYQLKIKNTRFKGCSLHEVDFTETELTGSVFDNCDMAGAIFDNSILEKADFRTSGNYSINPETNRIKKAKFSVTGITGLLDKYDIEIE